MTVINLNKTRKAKARAEAKVQANANAVKFGRTKGEKAGDVASGFKAITELDGKKRDP